jgi:hypothetical protein
VGDDSRVVAATKIQRMWRERKGEEAEGEECDCCGTTCIDHTSNKGRGSQSPCKYCKETRCKYCPCECEAEGEGEEEMKTWIQSGLWFEEESEGEEEMKTWMVTTEETAVNHYHGVRAPNAKRATELVEEGGRDYEVDRVEERVVDVYEEEEEE